MFVKRGSIELNIKNFILAALIVSISAQDKKQTPKFKSGANCKKKEKDCDAGLCCGEGVFKEDVVGGEVKEDYLKNMITVCFDEKSGKYKNKDDEEYWFICIHKMMEPTP